MTDLPSLPDEGSAMQQNQRRKTGIYLDHQASTPVDPRVVAAMQPYWSELFGNPHSTEHAFGWAADSAIDAARSDIAALIGADSDEVTFTSGATEANNLAILGIARAVTHERRRIVVSAIEHKCVLASARAAEREGAELVTLPVDRQGFVSVEAVAAAVDKRTALVSVMLVNNEIGTIQPIDKIAEICRSTGTLLHTDAAQALAVMPVNVERLGIDLMSLSGHKAYGPKGIGALYVRRSIPIRLEPIIHGGGQESGLRSGTLPTPLCVGFGMACQLLAAEGAMDRQHLLGLRERLLEGLHASVPGLMLNGPLLLRHPGNLSLRFPNVEAGLLLGQLQPDVAASSGAACSSGIPEASHVLRAIGLTVIEAGASIRLGVGRFTTMAEIDAAILHIRQALERIGAAIPMNV